VDYCVVGGRKGTLKFLHMHLGGHVITSTQLQVFVSYWCTELNYLWDLHGKHIGKFVQQKYLCHGILRSQSFYQVLFKSLCMVRGQRHMA
jgi:hypothetical protein